MSGAVAIIQARMTSTRLPGKSLLPLCGRPLVEHVIRRTQRIPGIQTVWVATTNDGSESPLVELCERLHVPVYRGSVEDVLSRYAAIALKEDVDTLMRITADCPFIDPEVSGRVLDTFCKAGGKFSYVSNTIERTFPRGLDTEVFSREALLAAQKEATDSPDREHVTRFFRIHPERFPMAQVKDLVDRSDWRWTVDTPEDYRFAGEVYERLIPQNPQFTYQDVLDVLERAPALAQINSHVSQKAEV